jgi:outer membrane protein assembly factor BamE (lipoprotein component of BamABCDE complex)
MNLQIILIILFFLTSCSYLTPHRIHIQQGNIIEQEQLNLVKLGMRKDQVQYILGTPMLLDPYHFNRWDYIHTFKKGRQDMEMSRLTLFFEDDELIKVSGDYQLGVKVSTNTYKSNEIVVPLSTKDDDNTLSSWFNWFKSDDEDDKKSPGEPEPNQVNTSVKVQEIIEQRRDEQ